jgi:hypothetical protein
MNWAMQRRLLYFLGLILLLLIIFAPPIYKRLNKEATCFDNKKNGDETGIDCGGSCLRVCDVDIEDPIVLWTRSFKVTEGIYNSVTMIENSNVDLEASNVSYTFKLFDDRNILVYERKGRTDLLSQKIFPIFEGSIFVGERIPAQTFFEFTNDISWDTKVEETPKVSVRNKTLLNEDTSPRIEAELENGSLIDIRDIEVIALVFDSKNNAITSSRTVVDILEKDSTVNVTFTWPKPFEGKANKIEVIAKVK